MQGNGRMEEERWMEERILTTIGNFLTFFLNTIVRINV